MLLNSGLGTRCQLISRGIALRVEATLVIFVYPILLVDNDHHVGSVVGHAIALMIGRATTIAPVVGAIFRVLQAVVIVVVRVSHLLLLLHHLSLMLMWLLLAGKIVV